MGKKCPFCNGHSVKKLENGNVIETICPFCQGSGSAKKISVDEICKTKKKGTTYKLSANKKIIREMIIAGKWDTFFYIKIEDFNKTIFEYFVLENNNWSIFYHTFLDIFNTSVEQKASKTNMRNIAGFSYVDFVGEVIKRRLQLKELII